MHPISHRTALRSFLVAGIVSLAAVAAPRVSKAQSTFSTRALLNPVPHTYAFPQPTWRPAHVAEAVASTVTGERALLVRTTSRLTVPTVEAGTVPVTPAEPVDGSRALLGRRGEGGRQ